MGAEQGTEGDPESRGQRVNRGKRGLPSQIMGNGSIGVPKSKIFFREWQEFGVERSFGEGKRRSGEARGRGAAGAKVGGRFA